MARATYSEKLRDPRWQRKRLEIFERDAWRCAWCTESTRPLTVHHRWYERGREPWDYPDAALVTLCETCHQHEYEGRPNSEAELLDAIRRTNFSAFDITFLAKGFSSIRMAGAPLVVAVALERLMGDEARMAALVEDLLDSERQQTIVRARELAGDIDGSTKS